MKIIFLLLVLLLAVCFHGDADDSQPATARYPHELPSYQFSSKARWRSLVPLVSTMADVRKALGDPANAVDLVHYGDKYPGDSKAEAPLFTYDLDEHWQILVYFAVPGNLAHDKLPDSMRGRLYSIDLVPKDRVPFRKTFPAAFTRSHIIAADAVWDEFVDSSGLKYEVYTIRGADGKVELGDLNRISYGPSDAKIKKYAKH